MRHQSNFTTHMSLMFLLLYGKKAAWLCVNHCKYTGPSQIDFCSSNIYVLIPVEDTKQDLV